MAQDRLWIIDPIDGTRAFMEGRKEWCVAAALAVNGRPVLAAVYTPRHDEFFIAARGEGATLNGARLTIPDSASLEGAHIAGNRKALASLAHLGIAADPSGSLPLQLRLAHVAAGRLAGAVSIGNRNDWDLAAGELLVSEAGGIVSGNSGEGYIYNRAQPWQQGLVAAGAKRHAALIDALNSQRTP
jgi:myo-inositol-1(or 4)-monophosphatase